MSFRPLLALCLALILALTSQSMAVARGMAAATGQMVICTGSGVTAVYVDAQGQPTGAPHICPDGAMHVPPAPPTTPTGVAPTAFASVIWQAKAPRQQVTAPTPRRAARAPPLV